MLKMDLKRFFEDAGLAYELDLLERKIVPLHQSNGSDSGYQKISLVTRSKIYENLKSFLLDYTFS